jgi:hypothetical protein
MGSVTYERPVEASLVVRLANGEEWKAKPEDLARFGYIQQADAYMAFQRHVTTVLLDAGLVDRELTEARINPLRYLVELAVMHPDLLQHPEIGDTNAEIVAIERALQSLPAAALEG